MALWGLTYDEDYFQSGIFATFTLVYQGEYGVYWDDILLARSYRKGEEAYLEVNITEPKQPAKEYAKTLIVEMATEDLATPSYDPIFYTTLGIDEDRFPTQRTLQRFPIPVIEGVQIRGRGVQNQSENPRGCTEKR